MNDDQRLLNRCTTLVKALSEAASRFADVASIIDMHGEYTDAGFLRESAKRFANIAGNVQSAIPDVDLGSKMDRMLASQIGLATKIAELHMDHGKACHNYGLDVRDSIIELLKSEAPEKDRPVVLDLITKIRQLPTPLLREYTENKAVLPPESPAVATVSREALAEPHVSVVMAEDVVGSLPI